MKFAAKNFYVERLVYTNCPIQKAIEIITNPQNGGVQVGKIKKLELNKDEGKYSVSHLRMDGDEATGNRTGITSKEVIEILLKNL